MPTRPIPFMPLNKSIDKTGTSTFNQRQMDGYWQEYQSPDGLKFVWHKRPGLSTFKNLSESAPVDGLHYWTRQQYVFASCNTKMFRIESDATQTDVTGTGNMVAAVRPTFADVAGSNLYAASSGKIAQYPAAGTGAYLTDPQSPTAVRWIDTINQTLVALQDDSERFDWADAGSPTSWTSLFATNETLPDLTKAFKVSNAYLYFFGRSGTEVWRDDGTTFVKEGQGAIQRGILAPYALKEINGTFYWLDDTLEVARLNGFQVEVISNPALTRYIRSFSTFSDAQGDYLRVAGKHFYILSFPVEGKTLVYDITLNQWYEWSYYNTVTAEHEQWLGSNVVHADDWNKIIVGSRKTGMVYDLSDSYTTDDGDTIRSVIRTDFIDHGRPDTFKRSHELTLVFKRADTNTTPKKMLIRHRDEGDTDWSAYREVEVEAQGKTELRVNERRWGIYKRRQWEFVMSDDTQAAMLGAEERFDFGR